jgi:LPXTG-motif cell wall-anchored protein
MNRFRIVLAAATLALVAQTLMADQWNKKTRVTFSAPVSVPGAVLPAGTYIFRLNDSNANRHIVQVQNLRGDKTYATILAIPDYRLNASSKTVMYFGERGAGATSAPAIKSWFYPGDNFGQRFVYKKAEGAQIAATYHQPVPVTEAPKPAAAPQAEVKVVTPEKTEQAYAPATFEKHDAQDTAGTEGEAVKEPVQQAEATPAPAPKKLPKTGSPFPMFGGLGLLALAGSGLFRYVGSRLR